MEDFRIDVKKGLEFGIYSIGDHTANPETNQRISVQQRIKELIEFAKLADQAGIDVFGLGESHQEHFATQAHTVILGAIAQATSKIKVASSVTVLSTSDPVRVYEDFSTIDLISDGRAEIVAGRGSRSGVYELLGYDLRDYEELFEEKFKLLLRLNKEETITWKGKFRAPLNEATMIPQPQNGSIPIWRSGGSPESAVKAGIAGVPINVGSLGGPSTGMLYNVNYYREAAKQAGHDPSTLPVANTGLFFTSDSSQQAMEDAYLHLDYVMKVQRGVGYPKHLFDEATDVRNSLIIGSPQQIIEKILYQHELLGHQRFFAQMDMGGVPFAKLMKNIELIGNEILPAVKKYTAKN